MNERDPAPGPIADADTMKLGLLMESVQVQQKLAETSWERLRAHTQDLDGVVREEIRRTLIDELRALTAESDRAVRALRDMKHAANIRCLMWNVGAAILCTAIPGTIAHYALPSQSDIAAMRAQRDLLAQNVAHLERRGGKVEWRSCGESARLCVRVDRGSPVYGENADYYIVKGY
jgi:hypothetical protein